VRRDSPPHRATTINRNNEVETAMNASVQAEMSTTQPTIAETIGAYAAGFRHGDIPAEVLEQARYILLDGLGIAFASTAFDFAKSAYAGLSGQEEGTSGTVVGIAGGLPLRDAVMMNAMLVHGLDYDDTYFGGGVHPTSSCFATALGVAENLDRSGRDLLTSYVLGMEVLTRVAGIAQGALNQGGLHPSSMLAGFGASVITGWLMNLNANQMTMAQGIALGAAGGTLESLVDGSWTKRMQPGWAAASGVTAARLARQGFIGARAAYEGKFGVYAAHMGARVSECDFSIGTRGLGETWNIRQVALKPFPACHAAQAVIQAALTISRETGVTADEVDTITAIVPPHYVKLVCEPIERKRRPDSMYGAQFSIPFTAACALLNGRFGLGQLTDTALRDVRTLELAQRVSYQVDTGFTAEQFKTSRPAELVVKTKDGRSLGHKVTKLMGSPDRPMTQAEIRDKFMDNAGSVMSAARAQAVFDLVMNIENIPSARAFARALRG